LSEATIKLTRREVRVLRQIRIGSPYAISQDILDKLKSMGLVLAIGNLLVISDEGLRRIEAGE
jgi:hypothetical protein